MWQKSSCVLVVHLFFKIHFKWNWNKAKLSLKKMNIVEGKITFEDKLISY